jgi:sugar/nucleoside kinase (ribokinase family)/predicted nucleotide-binding protein
VNHVAISSDAPEVIGFGALNVDYIASASLLSKRMSVQITESAARFESNIEGPVDQEVIEGAIQNLGAASLSCSLGGSAWLTIYALAEMRVGLRLGYIGVAGQIGVAGLSFIKQMEELGIDHRWVDRQPSHPCGVCLSYIEDTDRVMLTNPGANLEMYEYIRENFNSLAAYLASARHVHLTSFLDPRTPAEVLKLLRKAREINPDLQVSFDPGPDWTTRKPKVIDDILSLTDLLFVNYREFKVLGRYVPGESDIAIAAKILRTCRNNCRVFVTKRYDFIAAFRAAPDGILTYQFQLSRPPRETEIEDATGAGDIFAASVLASLTARRLQVQLGAFVGLCLARQKMSSSVPGAYQVLQDLSKGFLQQTETLSDSDRRPARVFLVHEGKRDWQAVRRFIVNECKLQVFELSLANVDENSLAEIMEEQLPRCSFAVCVLSTEASPGGVAENADQDLVHQAGILQGRYGFKRVAILAEESCKTFSNIAGLIHLDFPSGQVETTFFELERMFQRESLIRRRDNRRA